MTAWVCRRILTCKRPGLWLEIGKRSSRQLDGSVELERNNGTAVKITFAEPVYSELELIL
jgi:two-component sensor histidine kinase